MAKASQNIPGLNIRQIQVAQFLKSNRDEPTNVSSVSQIFGVSKMTAVRDLKDMEEQNLLTKKKQGRNVFYYPTEKLLNLLKDED